MFQYTKIELSPMTHQYKIKQNDRQLTYAQVIELWRTDADFRQFYNQTLATSVFDAYFWENPPINNDTIHQLYEFVLVNSPILSKVQASKKAFSKYFNEHKHGIVCFENLGKDALLIVPSPIIENLDFPHLSTLVRNATNSQLHAFWQIIGEQIKGRLSDEKIWVSTSGLGVFWLHIRLDDRPKYYQYRPYKLK
jgi:hypothetical protein